LVGNPQILPNPTADPDAANIKPDLDENCPRVEAIALIPAISSVSMTVSGLCYCF